MSEREQFTPSERQLALCVVRGLTNAEAASALGITPNTVNTKLKKMLRKAGLSTKYALAVALNAQYARRSTPVAGTTCSGCVGYAFYCSESLERESMPCCDRCDHPLAEATP